MPDGLVQSVNYGLAIRDDLPFVIVNVRDPTQSLLRRGDIVPPGAEHDDGRFHVAQVDAIPVGCTKQACDIRDNWGEFEELGATVLGISPDSAESHAGFRSNHKLPFPLLVDSDHAVAETYGAWGEKKNYGRTYMGIIRSGFVIDADGNLAAVKHNVKADKHREWALAELAKLGDRSPSR